MQIGSKFGLTRIICLKIHQPLLKSPFTHCCHTHNNSDMEAIIKSTFFTFLLFILFTSIIIFFTLHVPSLVFLLTLFYTFLCTFIHLFSLFLVLLPLRGVFLYWISLNNNKEEEEEMNACVTDDEKKLHMQKNIVYVVEIRGLSQDFVL